MQKREMSVRGVRRNVYLETQVTKGKARARTYVGSRVVSGVYQVYANGAERFTPTGVNAALV